LIDSKLEEEKCVDVVIPNANETSGASQRLLDELRSSSNLINSDDAQKILHDLCHNSATAIQELSILKRRTIQKCPFQKGDRIHLEDREDGRTQALLLHRKSWKKPYCIKINKVHYNKLKTMFEAVHDDSFVTNKKAIHAFHLIVLCLSLRYSSLSGGQLLNHLRGGGMQGAIHPHVFQTLRRHFEGRPFIEAFASPLNAYHLQFCSVFPCLDWHFGSIGNFFEQKSFKRGCYEVNPPFSPGLMMKMAKALQKHILKANKNDNSLVFVVIVPSVSDTAEGPKAFAKTSFDLLYELSSGQEILLKSRNHGYVEGSQHLRPTRYKESSYDTSVFIIQSKKAAAERKNNFIEQVEEGIREAFRNRDVEELNERRRITS